MKIRYKIHSVMLLSVALGAALALVFFRAQQDIGAAIAQERDLNEIATGIFQLALLGQDISLHPREFRARSQWLKQHREVDALLRKIRLDDPEGQAALNRMRDTHESLPELIEELRRLIRQQRETSAGEVLAEKLERQIYRLSFGVQSMLSDALSLERRKRTEITEYRRKVFGIALALAIVMTSTIAVLAYLIGRSIIQPLSRLRRDTEIVGAGNLDHRVDTAGRDELGDLSRDFDRMLRRLREVTTSRQDLQREVEARIRTEEALRESERSLKRAQEIAHLGSWELDIQSGQVNLSDEVYRIFGRQRGVFIPTYEAFMDTVHPDDRAWVAGNLERAAQGHGYDIEHRICLPNGDIRVVHQIGEVEFDGVGKPVKVLATMHEHKPTRMLGIVHDITERKRAEDELHEANARLGAQLMEIEKLQVILREQAIRDPLTGLFNRRYMEETLEREFAGAERENYPVSLIMMDIDHFKKINDTYGHPGGDVALKALSEQLRHHIRGRDIACRIGGEEFLAVLPHTPIQTAIQRAELWRTSFEALRMTHEGREIRATLSLGVAAFASHGKTGPEVIAAADRALYLAKEAGRNRVVVAQTPA